MARKLKKLIAPYPQEKLNGELGIISEDIAEVLGVNHNQVLEKFRRMDKNRWNSRGWRTNVYTSDNKSRPGPKREIVSFNTRAAKCFVARWGNELSDTYLNYLFDCEEIVAKAQAIKPEAKKAFEEMKMKYEALQEEENKRRKAKIKGTKIVKVEVDTIIEYDIYGVPMTKIIYEDKFYKDLTAEELEAYQIRQRAKTIKGLSDKQDQALNGENDKRLSQLKKQDTNILYLRPTKNKPTI